MTEHVTDVGDFLVEESYQVNGRFKNERGLSNDVNKYPCLFWPSGKETGNSK